jgi:hypothetical protein
MDGTANRFRRSQVRLSLENLEERAQPAGLFISPHISDRVAILKSDQALSAHAPVATAPTEVDDDAVSIIGSRLSDQSIADAWQQFNGASSATGRQVAASRLGQLRTTSTEPNVTSRGFFQFPDLSNHGDGDHQEDHRDMADIGEPDAFAKNAFHDGLDRNRIALSLPVPTTAADEEIGAAEAHTDFPSPVGSSVSKPLAMVFTLICSAASPAATSSFATTRGSSEDPAEFPGMPVIERGIAVPAAAIEQLARVQPPLRTGMDTAGDAEKTSAPSSARLINGWLQFDLGAVERGVSALVKRLDGLIDEGSRGTILVRGAICIVGVWAMYEIVRPRNRSDSNRLLTV